MILICGSGTTTASIPRQGSRWRSPGCSAAPGWYTTTRSAPAGRRTMPGLPYISDAELSARLTAAKVTPERAWLSEVSAVVLQQSLADLNAAYKNFFDSITGDRKGPKIGPPRLKTRKDRRQAVRFTANARFKVLPGGTLRLPKVGDIEVRWSRELPSEPSSVTVIKDAAGRYFASFVVETDPAADAGRFLSDGTVIRSPGFLRRAERKLRRAQRAHGRKQPVRSRASPDPAGEKHPRRRLVGVYPDAGVQGDPLRPPLQEGWPVRAHQLGLLRLRGEGRSEAAKRAPVDVRGLRNGARPGPQRGRGTRHRTEDDLTSTIVPGR